MGRRASRVLAHSAQVRHRQAHMVNQGAVCRHLRLASVHHLGRKGWLCRQACHRLALDHLLGNSLQGFNSSSSSRAMDEAGDADKQNQAFGEGVTAGQHGVTGLWLSSLETALLDHHSNCHVQRGSSDFVLHTISCTMLH